jgi:hypothetical protein
VGQINTEGPSLTRLAVDILVTGCSVFTLDLALPILHGSQIR